MNPVNKLLQRLNPEQYQAATSQSPVILVMAGAGSGKTSVLVSRIGNLQINERVGTSNMLALTFTRLAAKEMKERVGSLIGEGLARNLTAGTFHSFAVRILREYGHLVKIDRSFSIYDGDDKEALLTQIIADLRLTNVVRLSHIDPWRSDDADRNVQQVVNEYHYRLQRNNAIDLDGLLFRTREILTDHEDVRNELRQRFTHVFIDEAQDNDPIQHDCIELISPENLFVVGDVNQSIYGFRGARPEYLLELPSLHPETEIIRLEWNYRSTKPIIDLANRTIAQAAHTSPLQLVTDKDGVEPEIGIAATDGDEAMMVVGKIAEIGEPWNEIAVLARTNRLVYLMQTALEQQGIPAFVVSNKSDPLNAYDVRLTISYMTYLCNPRDEWSLRRIVNWPDRRLTDLEIQRIEHEAVDTGRGFGELVEERVGIASDASASMQAVSSSASSMWYWLIGYLGLESRYESHGLVNRIAQLEYAGAAIERWEETQIAMGDRIDPHAFLAWLRTRDMQDKFAQGDVDAVRILTIHGSKGLEWDNVFLVGCNDEILPSRSGDPEEECRLFYVAVTRAREKLHMSYAHERESWGGKMRPFEPSPFLLGVAS